MLKAYTDGACRISNPGLCSCAWVIYDTDIPTHELSAAKYLGPVLHTNNFAEYMGLIELLQYLYEHGFRNVKIHCDSALVVNQVNQEWQINDVQYRKMAAQAYGLLTAMGHTLVHIKGHDGEKGNERADELCNAILDAHMEEYENYVASKN